MERNKSQIVLKANIRVELTTETRRDICFPQTVKAVGGTRCPTLTPYKNKKIGKLNSAATVSAVVFSHFDMSYCCVKMGADIFTVLCFFNLIKS